MGKPNLPNIRRLNLRHKARVERYAQEIRRLYERLAAEGSRLASLAEYSSSSQDSGEAAPFRFSDYPWIREEESRMMSRFREDLRGVVMSGISEEWAESDLVQDLMARRVLVRWTGSDGREEFPRYYQRNPDVLKAFAERRERGLDLSSRVWNLSEMSRMELEDAISVSLAPGISAAELSREVRRCLNDPDLMFRRFRYKDEAGRWRRKWKKRYVDSEGRVRFEDCDRASYRDRWTGPGYYKSAYRNAMRLARTEINMAYRTAERTRWRQMDFVVGFEVKTTQNGRHVEDICDRLAGKYPKDFKFTGWHPQCMCYVIPILKTEEEFWSLDDAPSVNEVRDVPAGFRDWVKENESRIAKAREKGTAPWFLRDNEVYVSGAKEKSKEKGSEGSAEENSPLSEDVKKHTDEIKEEAQKTKAVNSPLSEEVKKRRDEIREEARKTIVGKPIYISQLDKTATISNKGVKEWLNQPHAHIAEKNELILNIQNVLNEAEYIGSGPDKHDIDAQAHLFEIRICGDQSWIIVRSLHDNRYLIHSISDNVKIKNLIVEKKKKP